MSALGHYQPLSIQPGERLLTATSGRSKEPPSWWPTLLDVCTARLRYFQPTPGVLDVVEKPNPGTVIERHGLQEAHSVIRCIVYLYDRHLYVEFRDSLSEFEHIDKKLFSP